MMNTDSASETLPPTSIVVKVGGSLYDHPALGPGLCQYLAMLDTRSILIVPGGGPFADVVRDLDRLHQLGESAAHQIALASLQAARAFMTEHSPGYEILDAQRFCATADALPHCWSVTTDSIALQAAIIHQARRLIVLKSIDIPVTCSWTDAATRGWIDPFFPTLAASSSVSIHCLNFRDWLNRHFTDTGFR